MSKKEIIKTEYNEYPLKTSSLLVKVDPQSINHILNIIWYL